jgi:hypothetical protein
MLQKLFHINRRHRRRVAPSPAFAAQQLEIVLNQPKIPVQIQKPSWPKQKLLLPGRNGAHVHKQSLLPLSKLAPFDSHLEAMRREKTLPQASKQLQVRQAEHGQVR